MLDLLIHVTAANKLSPAGHLLQVTDEEGRVLPQKPSTPIGNTVFQLVFTFLPFKSIPQIFYIFIFKKAFSFCLMRRGSSIQIQKRHSKDVDREMNIKRFSLYSLSGSLNAHKVYIVPKNRLSSGSSKSDRFAGTRPSYQAKTVTHFEPTFRVQVC